MKSLFDLLCCPTCKGNLEKDGEQLLCGRCPQKYPIYQGTPILFPGGEFPAVQHESQLSSVGTYYPWVHRMVMQSLLDNQVVIEIGAGENAVDDPCIVRTDVRWTPHTDVVCDAHFLPFKTECADFIFSLAVYEHLRNPFVASGEMLRVMKDGGYCYHECNFVFAYHGYPHHYFNASVQGMEQVFANYHKLRTGIAPYQMPSFALQMVLITYLRHAKEGDANFARFRKKLEAVLEDTMIDYDANFTEADAAYVAAGSFFFGRRADRENSTLIPAAILDIWKADAELRNRTPDPNDLGHADNLLQWAKTEGCKKYPAIERLLAGIETCQKRAGMDMSRGTVKGFAVTEPKFGTLWDFPECAPPRK